jgi:hypothetical protein
VKACAGAARTPSRAVATMVLAHIRRDLTHDVFVKPGIVPGTHVLLSAKEDVDGRDKPGHDVRNVSI